MVQVETVHNDLLELVSEADCLKEEQSPLAQQ